MERSTSRRRASFPDLLQEELKQAQTDLADVVTRQTVVGGGGSRFDYQEQEGVALRLYGLHVLVGDGDQSLPAIQSMVAPPVRGMATGQRAGGPRVDGACYHLGP